MWLNAVVIYYWAYTIGLTESWNWNWNCLMQDICGFGFYMKVSFCLLWYTFYIQSTFY